MKGKVKYRNYDRTMTVALLGDYILNLPYMIKTNDETYNKVSQMISDKITSFFFF